MIFIRFFVLSVLTISETISQYRNPSGYPSFYPSPYSNGFPSGLSSAFPSAQYRDNIYDYIENNGYPSQQHPVNNRQNHQGFEETSSSCDPYWSLQDTNNEQWILIRVSEPFYQTSKLTIVFLFNIVSNIRVNLEFTKDNQATLSDMQDGEPIYYRARFSQARVPKVLSIHHNDQLVCRDPEDSGYFVGTKVTAMNVFSSSGLQYRPRAYSRSTTSRPVQRPPTVTNSWPSFTTTRTPQTWPSDTTTRASQTSPTKIQSRDNNDLECGVADYKAPVTTGLMIGGQEAIEGQFPWLAAYFDKISNQFICGGILINTKMVLTAAHCIKPKGDVFAKKAENATFHLGKHDVKSSSADENAVASGVKTFIIHHDWDSNSVFYDADIAIAVLSTTVTFSKFLKPICTWTSTSSYHDLIGNIGVIAGRGLTGNSSTFVSTPKWMRIPVVDNETCLRSNTGFSLFTSKRMFCGGNRDDSGPCHGDSGGGLIFNSQNKWYLRGIISASLFDSLQYTCDTKYYEAYTDVAQFTAWINGIIQTLA